MARNPQESDDDDFEDYECLQELMVKIVIVGNSATGKSSMLLRYSKNEWDDNIGPTFGLEFAQKELIRAGTLMRVNIMDTAGQERFESIGDYFYRNAVGALLVFDVTSQESFDALPKWLDRLHKNAGEGIITMLIGNKQDLQDKRVVDYQTAADFAYEHDMGYQETSAKSGHNVTKSFDQIIEMIYEELKETVIETSDPTLENVKQDKNISEPQFGDETQPTSQMPDKYKKKTGIILDSTKLPKSEGNDYSTCKC